MKKNFLAALTIGLLMLGMTGVANSTTLSTDSYNLQNLGGNDGGFWGWGKTNWNLAAHLPINPLTDLAEVETMLSNGYTYVQGEYANWDNLNGIYNWGPTSAEREAFLDYTFNQDMELDSFSLQLTRVTSGASVTANTYLDGQLTGTYVNLMSSLSWYSQDTPGFLSFDLGGMTVDSISLVFNGHQGLHELQFDGDIAAPTPSPTPEPTTMVLFGLGILGFAGVSRRKQA